MQKESKFLGKFTPVEEVRQRL